MSKIDQQIIISNKFGDVTISNEDIKTYMVKYLDYMTDFEVEISSIDIDVIYNQKIAFQLILLINKNQYISLEKIDHIRESVNIIIRNHIGIEIESINVGVKYSND